MRTQTALLIFAALNVVWGAAFLGYAYRSKTPVIREDAGRLANSGPVSTTTNPTTTTSAVQQAAAPVIRSAPVGSNFAAAVQPVKVLAASPRQFGWQDVTNDSYRQYITNLRAVGCPEKQIRNMIVADVNDLFDKRRLEHAIKTDTQWWKAETYLGVVPMQTMITGNLDQERRDLLEKLLGEGWEDTVKLPSLNASAVNLTGPVLGALPADMWNEVQEICSRSMERHQAAMMARFNVGGQPDSTEMAKLRNQTRVDLAKVLTPDELEEFLLRYSHNSSKLRQEMRGFDLTPDEFRKIFRALDPLEHQMQLDYGGPEALSPKQREQFESQRDRIVREVLSAEKYQQFLLTKDPLYRQAQLTATQYGMNSKAIQPIYELQKAINAKRNQISQNNALSPAQKAQALNSINVEHQQTLQRMLGDMTYRR